jgi:hypothetical protein
MNRIVCALIAALCVTQFSAAHADDYVTLRAAVAGIDNYKQDYAAGIGLGHSLAHLIPHFALEGEFIKSFSQMKSTAAKRTFAMTSVFGVFTYPLEQRFLIKGKYGLRYASFKDKDKASTGITNSSDTGSAYGLGALYALDRTRELSAEYVTSDTNDFYQFVVGLQLHF